jgi:serine/threonine-protein kinase
MTSQPEPSRTLTPELIAEATWRLGWLGVIYSAAIAFELLVRHVFPLVTATGSPGLDAIDVFRLGGIALGLAMFALSRSQFVAPQQLLDFGLLFEVAGAFAIAAAEFRHGVPASAYESFALLPAECLWIVVFPLVVPSAPHKVLVASLAAATMGPAALVLAIKINGIVVDRPIQLATFFVTSDYLSAAAAYAVARIAHRVHVRLKHAREIGSYELVERIGEGGMGEVWRAKHRMLARPAAIKLIRASAIGSNRQAREMMIHRFQREAQETATLRSTHTIEVYDYGVTEQGDFYYVMELLEGLSLDQLVARYGPQQPARAVHILQQVCHSLSEAHARGLLHRDIKPANIFLCRLGPDDDFVKVLDFGLVKHFDRVSANLTLDGMVTGTPAYMAPELALGRQEVDGRSDLYSLGCVAYYLLTGHHVFRRATPIETVLAHVRDQAARPSAGSDLHIPEALDALVLECLAKDPLARPFSATVLGQRLAETVSANPWTPDAAHSWWQQHRARAGHIASRPGEPAAASTGRASVRFLPALDTTSVRTQVG